MATTPRTPAVEYPTRDGKPMAETELHAQDMIDLIETLRDHFAADPDVYIWGNLLLYYEEGNPRKSVAPDVFFVRGVPKEPPREYYLVWQEGKSPDVVIEITSKTTRREDRHKKRALYRDVLKVAEYFQFDPREEYLTPPLQGFRLVGGEYETIASVSGRLPSERLGLHLEREGTELRLFDPATGQRLPTRQERAMAAEERAITAEERAVTAEERAARAESANERLQREIEELRRRLGSSES